MNCKEIFEGLSDYIDEEMAEKTCHEIEEHLKGCENCRVVVNTLRRTVTLYHSLEPQCLPGDAKLRLHKIIKLEGKQD